MSRGEKAKQTATRTLPGVEALVVEVSLEHPDYSARRLVPLLKQEGIQVSASAADAIPKPNNLHTKSMRLSKLEVQRSEETLTEPVSTKPPKAAEQNQPPAHTPETKPQPRISPSIIALKKSNPRRPWALSVPNILLLGIIGYFWVSAMGNFLNAGRELLPGAPPPMTDIASKPKADVHPLEDYGIITERNLFGVSEVEASALQEDLDLEGLPVSMKVAGFKLLGTVASDDSTKSFAILDNPSTRKQELYREGDKVGEALIKKILRNKVVLNTDKGDEVLTVELKENPESTKIARAPVGSETPAAQSSTISLDRSEVDPYFSDLNQLKEQIRTHPIEEDGVPAGFLIRNIKRGSILWKMGLRDRDVITGVNGGSITSPDEAERLFQILKEGGEISIEIKRRGRPQVLRLEIG
jgi:type II secretion system protein C